jgi:hypothetical protein
VPTTFDAAIATSSSATTPATLLSTQHPIRVRGAVLGLGRS